MKERPILLKGEMVRAILRDRKTQTRRILKTDHHDIVECEDGSLWPWREDLENGGDIWYPCPYGKPGDRLYVKETFWAWGRWETRFNSKRGRDEWNFLDMTREDRKEYIYASDGVAEMDASKSRSGALPAYWKRPSIFMPRWASRITLEITSVRVERLQDISEADALAEGIDHDSPHRSYFASDQGGPAFGSAGAAYRHLWNGINGPGSWDANPWVWVVEFRRVEP